MTASDIMAKSPAVCLPDTSLYEVARSMVEHDCGAIPVLESRDSPRPVGVVTDRDIVVRILAENRNPLECRAADAMTAGVATVSPGMDLAACLHVMEQHQVRRVPVVSETGTVIGILSQADVVLNVAAEQSAELLREVSSEDELAAKMPTGGTYSG